MNRTFTQKEIDFLKNAKQPSPAMKQGIFLPSLVGGTWLIASSVLLLILRHVARVQESIHADTVLPSYVIQ